MGRRFGGAPVGCPCPLGGMGSSLGKVDSGSSAPESQSPSPGAGGCPMGNGQGGCVGYWDDCMDASSGLAGRWSPSVSDGAGTEDPLPSPSAAITFL